MSFSIDEQRRLSEVEKQTPFCFPPVITMFIFFGITKIVSLPSQYCCSLGRLH